MSARDRKRSKSEMKDAMIGCLTERMRTVNECVTERVTERVVSEWEMKEWVRTITTSEGVTVPLPLLSLTYRQ